jgi:hypothetical protein
MKTESIVQDLLDLLQIGKKEMAEFFNISQELFNQSALSCRKFPFHFNQRLSANWWFVIRDEVSVRK